MKKGLVLFLVIIMFLGCSSDEMQPEILSRWEGSGVMGHHYVFGEEGYFYVRNMVQGEGIPIEQINYTEYGSDISMPLCTKPNCLHNEESECMACIDGGVLVKAEKDGIYLFQYDEEKDILNLNFVFYDGRGKEVRWSMAATKSRKPEADYHLGTNSTDLVVGENHIIAGIMRQTMYLNESKNGYDADYMYEIHEISLITGESRKLWEYEVVRGDEEVNYAYDLIYMQGAVDNKVYLSKSYISESVDTVIWEINRETGEVCELIRFEHISDYGMVGKNPVRSWEGKIYYEMKQAGQWYLESLDVITKERKNICKLEENEEFAGVYWGAGVAAMMVRNEMGLIYTTPVDLVSGERVEGIPRKILDSCIFQGVKYTVDYENKTNAGLPIIEVME